MICLMKSCVTFWFSWLTIRTLSMLVLRVLARLLCPRRTASGGDCACFISPALSGTPCCVRPRTSTASAGNSFILDSSGSQQVHTNIHILQILLFVLNVNVKGGATGRALDLRSTGRGFKSYSGKSCITTLGKLLTPMCLCHQAV